MKDSIRRFLTSLACLAVAISAPTDAGPDLRHPPFSHRRAAGKVAEGRAAAWHRLLDRARRVTFHSAAASGGISVPISVSDGNIYVQATVAGRPVQCILDTGTSELSMPEGLRLPLVTTHLKTWAVPYQGAVARPATWMLLSDIRIGGYELSGCPTQVFRRMPTDNPYANMVVLGDIVFARSVLTIDYQRRRLMIHPFRSGQPPRCQKPQDRVFQFVWAAKDLFGGPGSPSLAGSVGGHLVHFLIDTSAYYGATELRSPKIISAILAGKHFPRKYGGSGAGLVIPRLSFALTGTSPSWRGLHFTDRAIVWPEGAVETTQGIDALLGWSLLRNYRVTIDYPARTLLLQPARRRLSIREQRASVRSFPGDSNAHFSLAVAYFQCGHWRQAGRECRRSQAIIPGDYCFYVANGLCQSRLHRYGDAIREFRRAIVLNPQYMPTYALLGKALAERRHIHRHHS